MNDLPTPLGRRGCIVTTIHVPRATIARGTMRVTLGDSRGNGIFRTAVSLVEEHGLPTGNVGHFDYLAALR